jgi:hypothetical protein
VGRTINTRFDLDINYGNQTNYEGRLMAANLLQLARHDVARALLATARFLVNPWV